MPVQKFRSFEEARDSLWSRPDDPQYIGKVAWLWAFSERLYRHRFPRGVHRYKSAEEAASALETWEK